MHIFFSGIGGSGIGPLALIARQAGYDVSGSDKQASAMTEQLQHKGIGITIGQTEKLIAAVHAAKPIDWFVYSSAVPKENPNHPELKFVEDHNIKHSKRDELLNQIMSDKNLSMIGVAGTHGKSTTTAMLVWLCNQINLPISYSVGAKLPFGPTGQFTEGSKYFIYECDEFDRNFLAFHPSLSVITGISWDHHEIFPSQQEYYQAFRDFIGQSGETFAWHEDAQQLRLEASERLHVLDDNEQQISTITLPGVSNRLDAWLAVQAIHQVTNTPIEQLVEHVNAFPGLAQRMEQLAPNLYSNYAHTPEKIAAGMSAALETAAEGQKVIVIYEPLTNRRQYFIKDAYKNCFDGATKVYWVPTYLAREDPNQPVLTPEELIPSLSDPGIAEPAKMDDSLLAKLQQHLKDGAMVVGMGASGGGSLDEWLRNHIHTLR